MALYTERHGMRKPIERTSTISIEFYLLILNCCQKYYKYLTYLFPQKCHNDFMNMDYLNFSENQFQERLKIKIPELFRDKDGRISSPEKDDKYDQYALLDLIEFIAQNAKDISEGWNHSRHKNYWHIDLLETSDVFSDYQNEVNEIFVESGLLYTLTSGKIIERVLEDSVLTPEVETSIEGMKEPATKKLLKEAIILYRQPYPQKQIKAVEKIWDALESLKTHFPGIEKNHYDEKLARRLANGQEKVEALFKKELSELGNIGNNYSIRHFDDKQVVINDGRHYDYFFNRCLSLISTAIKYLQP